MGVYNFRILEITKKLQHCKVTRKCKFVHLSSSYPLLDILTVVLKTGCILGDGPGWSWEEQTDQETP